jgi:hypothetical protein
MNQKIQKQYSSHRIMYSYDNKYVHLSILHGTLIVRHVTLYHESPVTRLLEVAIL